MANDPRFEQQVLDSSVRQQAPDSFAGALSSVWWHNNSNASDILPEWGLPWRDHMLRQFWYAVHNTLVQGAITNLINRVASTPWEINGGRNLTRYYQDMLQNAEFGAGWSAFIEKTLTDYYTQDFGAVVEVIGPGSADGPLRGRVEGLAHLDRGQCIATGNFEYPIWYHNDVTDTTQSATWHQLHNSRVVRLTDMPSPIERAKGTGLSALSRAISVSNAQILMGQYQNERLTNEPPLGLITFGNVMPGDVDQFRRAYMADRARDGNSTYAPLMQMQAVDPTQPIQVEFIPFSQLPDHFNLTEYMQAHVNMLALALGVDPQDIWPLTGQMAGTATQSKVLAAKGQGKALAKAYSMLERMLNLWILPPGLEFSFKYEDAERDKEEAETAQVWTGVTTQLLGQGALTEDEARRLLANRVPAFADVLRDEAGQVRLIDDDVTEDGGEIEDITNADMVAEDDTTPVAAEADAQPTTGGDDTPVDEQRSLGGLRVAPDGPGRRHADPSEGRATKDYTATAAAFIESLADTITGAQAGDITRRRAGTIMRAQLARLGRQAYRDGLEDGGVDVGDDGLSADDQAIVAAWLAEQSGFVTNFLNSIYREDRRYDAEDRARMWANKSLNSIYERGRLEADANGLYEWKLGNTEEHCDDCLRLNGQRHRLREYHRRNLIPQSSDLACKGYNCDCTLVRVSGRARGRF